VRGLSGCVDCGGRGRERREGFRGVLTAVVVAGSGARAVCFVLAVRADG
jgi:hypothetical protein